MSDKLRIQENDPEIRNLRHLLASVDVPAANDARMNGIARNVFAELDERRVLRARRSSPLSLEDIFFMGRPALGMACCALAVVGVGAGLLQIAHIGSPAPLAAACVVRAEGGACETGAEGADRAGMWEPADLSSPVGAGRLFRTGEKGSLTIALEPGTGFQVFGDSRLDILKADTRGFTAFLEKGSVLFEVTKRAHGRTFRIVTPNAVCEIAGTIFKVDVLSQPGDSNITTVLSVLEGTVRFTERGASKNHVLVRGGAFASVKGRALGETAPLAPDRKTAARLQTLGPALVSHRGSAQAWGTVSVVSEPAGANVFLNDIWEGVTPIVVVKPVGPYRLSVSYLNYQPVDTVIAVTPEREARLRAALPELSPPQPKSTLAKRVGKAFRERRKPQPVSAQALVPAERAAIETSPEYVDAQAKIAGGRYADAVLVLIELKERPTLTRDDRLAVLGQLHLCFKQLADYRRAVEVLEEMYEETDSPVSKGNILWEIAGVKADRLEDPAGAEMDLVEYLVTQPRGVWLYEAYGRLAEVQYVLGKYRAAAKTYATMISTFREEPDIDGAMYALALVEQQDLDDCAAAVRWYTMLLKERPGSGHAADAVFWRAECLLRMGRIQEAREDYVGYAAQYSTGRWKELVRERIAGFHR